MSEYQYYEFVAVDHPLADEDRAALRQITSRAEITAWRLQNVYNWGNFRGNPLELMTRYFDMFVYVANWGTNEWMVRLPQSVLPAEVVRPYDNYDVLSVHLRGEYVILDLTYQDEEGGGWIDDQDAESWMPALLPLRDDLARGDLRALYIGWLAGVSPGDMDREATEPPLPPGLGQPTAALEALARLLHVDRDLLAAAAEASPPLDATPEHAALAAWVERLPSAEKDAALARLLEGRAPLLRAELLRRFAREQPQGPPAPRRLVGEILDRGEALREARERAAAEAETRRREEQALREAAARAARLERLAERQAAVWDEVEALIATRVPKNYEEPVAYLVDLRDLAERDGTTPAYHERLAAIRERHGRKASLMRALDAALKNRA